VTYVCGGATAKRIRQRLDATLLNSFPGYAFIEGFAENLARPKNSLEASG
jgi:hypothetical protein